MEPQKGKVDPFEKLKPMEDFCRTNGIFFDDTDRIRQQIKATEGLYKEYKKTLSRGFDNQLLRESGEEKKLKVLLNQCQYDV